MCSSDLEEKVTHIQTENKLNTKTFNKKNITFSSHNQPNNRAKPNWETKRKITAMHNIKVRKQTTNAQPHTLKSRSKQRNNFALKLENETNENDTTTANDILQNTQTTCPTKQCKLAYPSDTWHNSCFLRKKQTHKPHMCCS